MKKFGLFILGLCTVFFVGNLTQAKDYEYTNLDITANILIDGTIDVKEDFTANFFVSKHGIIRDIPLNYTVGGKDFHIEVSNISVQGKTYSPSQNNGNIEIKIGDADRTLIGEQNYPISYKIYGLIRNFSGMGYAELYWNLVGYNFDTNIKKVRAELILPKAYTGFTKDDFLITTDGESKTIDGFNGTVDWSKGDKIIITYDETLPAYQGITLAIKFPNNYFEFDHDRQAGLIGNHNQELSYQDKYQISENQYNENKKNSIMQFKRDLKLLIVSILGLIIFFGFKIFCKIRNFYETRKNPLVVQYYPPEGMSPSEISYLYNKRITPYCISSMIYKRACEKRITIKNERKNFLFFHSNNIKIIKGENAYTKKQLTLAPTYEKLCRNYLFENGTKDATLPDTEFSRNIIEVNKEIKRHCEDKNLVKENKILTVLFRTLISLSILVLWPFGPLIIGVFLAYNFETISLLIKFIISGTILNPYGNIDRYIFDSGPQYILVILIIGLAIYIFKSLIKIATYAGNYENLNFTEKGEKLLTEIYGYKKFIKSCEESQLRKFIEEDPDYINKVLPYAAALGLETQLMKAVIPIYEEKGYNFCWYDGELSTFTKTMNNFPSSFHEYHQSSNGSSYSSDSGFDSGSSFDSGGSSFDSGGGGGGGGGSSW